MDMPALQRLCPRQVERCVVEQQQLATQAPVYILRDAAGDRYMKMSEEGLFLWQLMDGTRTGAPSIANGDFSLLVFRWNDGDAGNEEGGEKFSHGVSFSIVRGECVPAV